MGFRTRNRGKASAKPRQKTREEKKRKKKKEWTCGASSFFKRKQRRRTNGGEKGTEKGRAHWAERDGEKNRTERLKKHERRKQRRDGDRELEDNAGAYKATEAELWPVIHHASVSRIREQARRTKNEEEPENKKASPPADQVSSSSSPLFILTHRLLFTLNFNSHILTHFLYSAHARVKSLHASFL